uniref:Uncharacterized protein n=1 Tax=Romanomermis culicivorax TaxID=13658 RepID=A0A915I476_ROMCU
MQQQHNLHCSASQADARTDGGGTDRGHVSCHDIQICPNDRRCHNGTCHEGTLMLAKPIRGPSIESVKLHMDVYSKTDALLGRQDYFYKTHARSYPKKTCPKNNEFYC